MHDSRMLALATSLVLIIVELSHAGAADYSLARLQQDQGATSEPMQDPGIVTTFPNMDLWVATRGSSDKYVVAHLKAAATRHGLGCTEYTPPGPRLQCHFKDDLHESIFAYDEDETGLRVEVYYLDSAFEEIDAARKRTIDAIVRQFANDIKRGEKVRAIDWCRFPHLNCKSLNTNQRIRDQHDICALWRHP
jgi:hypothetical protein